MESSDDGFWYFFSLYSLFSAVRVGVMVCKMGNGRDGGVYWALGLLAVGGPLCLLSLPGYCGLVVLVVSLWGCDLVLGRGEEMLPVQGRAVLITGCDTGFGHALAKVLRDKGVTVFAGVLDENSPGALELRGRSLHGVSGGSLQVLQLDVTKRGQIERAHQHICTQVGEAGLWGMVNNAGMLGCVTDGEILPVKVYRSCLAVNFLGAVEMCQVFLPLLRRSRGRIVNICSLAGDQPIPGFAAYGASKAALNIFSGVLRLEMAKWGVKVATVQPTGFRTNIFGSSEDWSRYQEDILTNLSQDARQVYGEAYVRSLQNSFVKMADRSSGDLGPVLADLCHALLSAAPKPLYTPGRCAWLLPFLHRLCPTPLYDVITASLFQFNGCTPAGLTGGLGSSEPTDFT